MTIKIILTILGLLNGGYILVDGIYVMLNNKYIGPKKPGPWAPADRNDCISNCSFHIIHLQSKF